MLNENVQLIRKRRRRPRRSIRDARRGECSGRNPSDGVSQAKTVKVDSKLGGLVAVDSFKTHL